MLRPIGVLDQHCQRRVIRCTGIVGDRGRSRRQAGFGSTRFTGRRPGAVVGHPFGHRNGDNRCAKHDQQHHGSDATQLIGPLLQQGCRPRGTAAQSNAGDERQQCDQHEPLEDIIPHDPFSTIHPSAHQRRNVRVVDGLQVQRTCAGRHVGTFGGERHFAERFTIQASADGLASVVTNLRSRPGLRIGDEQLAARFIAKADRDYLDAPLRRGTSGLDRIRIVILAIGDQNNCPRHIGLTAETLNGLANRRLETSAAPSDAGRSDAFEHEAEEAEIGRHRTEYGRPAGESDQPDLVAIQIRQQIDQFRLGPLQPIRRGVLGQHRFTDIQADHNLGADAGSRMTRGSELGSHQGDHDRHGRRAQQADRHPATNGRPAVQQSLLHVGRDEAIQQRRAAKFKPRQQRDQSDDEPRSVDPLRTIEMQRVHGSLLSTVPPATTAMPIRPHAPANSGAKCSWYCRYRTSVISVRSNRSISP